MPSAVCVVDNLSIFFGDKSLPVKLQSVYIHKFFHTVIAPNTALAFLSLHGDDRQPALGKNRVVNHDDTMGTVDFDTVDAHPTGEHQTIVSVKFGELAAVNLQIHHDAAAHRFVIIPADERQLCLTAHAPGALEGNIGMRAAAKVQHDPLGTEHSLRLLLAGEIFLSLCPVVEDAGEIHVEDDLRKVGNHSLIFRHGKIVPMQDAHNLIEKRVVILLRGKGHALFCFGGIEGKGVRSILFSGIAENTPGGQLVDLIFHRQHRLASCKNNCTTKPSV